MKTYKYYTSQINGSFYESIRNVIGENHIVDDNGYLNNYASSEPIKWSTYNFYWFKNGFLHRENGPAAIHENYERYYLNGIEYGEREYMINLREQKLKRILK